MRPDDSVLLYNVGCIYSLIGLERKALESLAIIVQPQALGGADRTER